jgi:acetyltransferase-like isoleucine patch superfamily enzyme
MTRPPVCLFVYSRLAETRRTVEALGAARGADETNLHVFSDGPKPGAEEKVAKVREYLRSIVGFKSIVVHEADLNKGLAASIIEGVSSILQDHDAAVVLEDDLLVSRNFLDFMSAALDKYRPNPKVLSVSGYSFPIQHADGYPYDAVFGIRASSWGWATWKDRWGNIDWTCAEYKNFRWNPIARWRFNSGGSDMSRMLDRQMNKKINSWAIRFCFHQHLHDMVDVVPVVSKVQNIGRDGTEGENCNQLGERFLTNLDVSEIQDFRFPDDIVKDREVLRQFRSHNSIRARLLSKWTRFRGASGPLQTLLRRASISAVPSFFRMAMILVRGHGRVRFGGFLHYLGPLVEVECGSGSIRFVGKNYLSRGTSLRSDGGRITVGFNTFVNKDCQIVSMRSIAIGRDCLIAERVSIYDHDHGFSDPGVPFCRQGFVTAPVEIGDNVWIGANAVILKGVTIGSGSIVAAGAVVTKNVPSGVVVAGNPARVVKVVGGRA